MRTPTLHDFPVPKNQSDPKPTPTLKPEPQNPERRYWALKLSSMPILLCAAYLEREAQAVPGALVGTGPSAARWRPHHHWGEAPETGVSWNKVKLTGRLL
jgi:hypothetical protein